MKSPVDKLLNEHKELIHSDHQKVLSHVQREEGEWFINTVLIDGCSAPFKYKRKKEYRNLQGRRVNLTYYRSVQSVAGIEMEMMNVVRIKVS
ncbi:MAG: hypothetical protein ABW148_13610 [Sedimenticola sp.]